MRLDFTSSTSTLLLQVDNNYLGVSDCNEDNSICRYSTELGDYQKKIDGSEVEIHEGSISMPLDVENFGT